MVNIHGLHLEAADREGPLHGVEHEAGLAAAAGLAVEDIAEELLEGGQAGRRPVDGYIGALAEVEQAHVVQAVDVVGVGVGVDDGVDVLDVVVEYLAAQGPGRYPPGCCARCGRPGWRIAIARCGWPPRRGGRYPQSQVMTGTPVEAPAAEYGYLKGHGALASSVGDQPWAEIGLRLSLPGGAWLHGWRWGAARQGARLPFSPAPGVLVNRAYGARAAPGLSADRPKHFLPARCWGCVCAGVNRENLRLPSRSLVILAAGHPGCHPV